MQAGDRVTHKDDYDRAFIVGNIGSNTFTLVDDFTQAVYVYDLVFLSDFYPVPESAPKIPEEAKPGRKDDNGKSRVDLISTVADDLEGQVLAFGAQKYEEESWQRVPDARKRYFAAARRHLNKWKAGEINDKESGLPHLAHARCCITFLLALENGFDPVLK